MFSLPVGAHTHIKRRRGGTPSRDYQELIRNLEKLQRARQGKALGPLCRLAEDLVERTSGSGSKTAPLAAIRKSDFRNKTSVTRPRPGIDRVSSAWLIKKFIDPEARFAFSSSPAKVRKAIAFDSFEGVGFTHVEDRCTFETLCRKFGLRDARVLAIAQIVHDADLHDDKFGRSEG